MDSVVCNFNPEQRGKIERIHILLLSLPLFLWWTVIWCQDHNHHHYHSHPHRNCLTPYRRGKVLLWQIHLISTRMAWDQKAEVCSSEELLYLDQKKERKLQLSQWKPHPQWIWICSIISRFENMVLCSKSQIPGSEKWQNYTQGLSTSLELCLFLCADNTLLHKFRLHFISLKQNLFNTVHS